VAVWTLETDNSARAPAQQMLRGRSLALVMALAVCSGAQPPPPSVQCVVPPLPPNTVYEEAQCGERSTPLYCRRIYEAQMLRTTPCAAWALIG